MIAEILSAVIPNFSIMYCSLGSNHEEGEFSI